MTPSTGCAATPRPRDLPPPRRPARLRPRPHRWRGRRRRSRHRSDRIRQQLSRLLACSVASSSARRSSTIALRRQRKVRAKIVTLEGDIKVGGAMTGGRQRGRSRWPRPPQERDPSPRREPVDGQGTAPAAGERDAAKNGLRPVDAGRPAARSEGRAGAVRPWPS